MEKVNHPAHYAGRGLECIDAIRAAAADLDGFEGFCAGNVMKYLWRFRQKNGVEDLRKARWYLEALIDYEGLDGPADTPSAAD